MESNARGQQVELSKRQFTKEDAESLASLYAEVSTNTNVAREKIKDKKLFEVCDLVQQILSATHKMTVILERAISPSGVERLRKSSLRVVAELNLCLGQAMVESGSWQEGLETLQRTFEVFRKIGNLDGMARAHLEIGTVQELFGDYEVAKLSFLSAERLFKKTKREDGIAVAELQLGTLALDYYDYEQARQHLKFASSFFHQHGDKKRAELSDGLLNLADEYERDLAMV